jgi:fatty-acyl-CoA synthase
LRTSRSDEDDPNITAAAQREEMSMAAPVIERAQQSYAYPLLIKQLLHAPLSHSSEQTIVYRDRVRLTYREWHTRVNRLAAGLASLGVRPGDTVAMLDWDSHRYLEAYFAVPMMGATLMTANVRLAPEQIAYTLRHCGASVILANTEFAPLLASLPEPLNAVRAFVLLDDVGDTKPPNLPGAVEYEEMLAAATPQYDFEDFDENTRATTFYTTGTTGLPKGVAFSHRQLVLHTLATNAFFAASAPGQCFRRDDVYMPITPMFHVHAWGLPYVATAMGVKQVYPGRYDPALLVELKRREGVTFSHCVPTILQMILASPAAKREALAGWKMVIGGSALPRALAAAALERGIDVWAGYGMSETCPILSTAQVKPELAGRDGEIELRTKSGLRPPLVDLRIVDAEMNPLPADGKTAGEVVVRAPWLTMAYQRNPDASKALWDGGWLHTQDIGTIDREGYLQITDRLKDVIKTGGEWVSSLELEDLITQLAGVAEVAVFAVRHEKWGERPVAVVVRRAGAATFDEDAVKAHIAAFAAAGRISKIAVPERVHFVEAIAKTSVGKINKRALREQYDPR